jgi:glycine oxidase
VVIRSGVEVSRLLVERGRAVGVMAEGMRVEAERVVLAAGAWSGDLAAGVGARLPVGPARGQMLAVYHSPALLTRVIHDETVYLVPRRSGELLVGATVEHAGFERLVTPEAMERLIAAAVALVPELAGRPMLRAWCGFRPWAEDSQPVLGPWPGVRGLYVATGHFRNGILLAPVTGALMAQTILDGSISELMWPFLPDRFLQEGAPR